MKEIIKIKITKCENESCWYFERIGEEFEVLKDGGQMGYLVKKNITINFYVDKKDCKII